MKILNIYGQYDNHTEAKIIGNRAGLEALSQAIHDALRIGRGTTDSFKDDNNFLMASDGEGYEVIIEMHNDTWGWVKGTEKPDPNSYWNKVKSYPQYIRRIL
jgi:hypothetical protein